MTDEQKLEMMKFIYFDFVVNYVTIYVLRRKQSSLDLSHSFTNLLGKTTLDKLQTYPILSSEIKSESHQIVTFPFKLIYFSLNRGFKHSPTIFRSEFIGIGNFTKNQSAFLSNFPDFIEN